MVSKVYATKSIHTEFTLLVVENSSCNALMVLASDQLLCHDPEPHLVASVFCATTTQHEEEIWHVRTASLMNTAYRKCFAFTMP